MSPIRIVPALKRNFKPNIGIEGFLYKELEKKSILWHNKDRKIFRVPWKHMSAKGWSLESDANLFLLYNQSKGREVPDDLTLLKSQFRNAMNKATRKTHPKIRLIDDNISKAKSGNDPYRLYQFTEWENPSVVEDCAVSVGISTEQRVCSPPTASSASATKADSSDVGVSQTCVSYDHVLNIASDVVSGNLPNFDTLLTEGEGPSEATFSSSGSSYSERTAPVVVTNTTCVCDLGNGLLPLSSGITPALSDSLSPELHNLLLMLPLDIPLSLNNSLSPLLSGMWPLSSSMSPDISSGLASSGMSPVLSVELSPLSSSGNLTKDWSMSPVDSNDVSSRDMEWYANSVDLLGTDAGGYTDTPPHGDCLKSDAMLSTNTTDQLSQETSHSLTYPPSSLTDVTDRESDFLESMMRFIDELE